MNLAKESYLFEYEQRLQLANLDRRRMINEALVEQRHPRLITRIAKFFQTLNHLRRIRIEVTFDYQEMHPVTSGR